MAEALTCDGCGSPLKLAPAIGWFCPIRTCDHERRLADKVWRTFQGRQERAEYERLKAKFEGNSDG